MTSCPPERSTLTDELAETSHDEPFAGSEKSSTISATVPSP
jgi:hypothetical protein